MTRVTYDAQNVLADLTSANALLTRYVNGDAPNQLFARISSGGTAAWYLTDRLGSVRDLTDNTGAVQDHIDYDGFGNVTNELHPAFSDRFKFQGMQFQVIIGMYGTWARFYDPGTGRWTSQDPLGFNPGDENLYRFVKNSPTNATDQMGEAAVSSITVTANKDNQSGHAGEGGLDVWWLIVIKGDNLKHFEIAQFVTNRTSMWDDKGAKLTKAQILKAYEDDKIDFTKPSAPFSTNEKDTGFGEGDEWRQFKNDDKEEINDHHVFEVPEYKDKEGEKQWYAFQIDASMKIIVRDKCTAKEVFTHTWSYTFQNYEGKNPKAPVTDDEPAGIYAYKGIQTVWFDKTTGNK